MSEPVKPSPIGIALPSTGLEEWEAVREPLESGWLTQGPKVAAFEKAFAIRHQVPHAIATTSCTTALHLALLALGIGPGDEVIVPAFTWVATANVVVYCGATPIFADVRRETFNIDPDAVARCVTPRTRALIAVHLFGLPADIDALRSALPDHVAIVEDAACAAGASFRGRSVGALGEVAAFSFHPRKAITTGEGGMLTTLDPARAATAEMLRNHGAATSEEDRHRGPRPYQMAEFNMLGFNYRMTDLQGAVGLVQLGKLDRFIRERQVWAGYYDTELAKVPWLRTPAVPADVQHAWQSYVVYVDPDSAPMPRNEMMERLHRLGIATRPGTHAVHGLGYYRQKFGTSPEQFPAAWDCERQSMAIPLHNRMAPTDFERVVEALASF